MQCRKDDVYKKAYRDNTGRYKKILGGILIAIGSLILVLCIPGWAWCSLIGVALIIVGVLLL